MSWHVVTAGGMRYEPSYLFCPNPREWSCLYFKQRKSTNIQAGMLIIPLFKMLLFVIYFRLRFFEMVIFGLRLIHIDRKPLLLKLDRKNIIWYSNRTFYEFIFCLRFMTENYYILFPVLFYEFIYWGIPQFIDKKLNCNYNLFLFFFFL